MIGEVLAVHASSRHGFSKASRDAIMLLAGLGVAGDAHAGATVKHRSRVAADPSQPNLRQIHFIASELLDDVGALGFDVGFGALGENVTTRGIDLIGLPRGTRFTIGEAEIEITGLRNPCHQIEDFRPGLLKHMIGRDADGTPLLRTGVMGVIARGGTVRPGDAITVALPPAPYIKLRRV